VRLIQRSNLPIATVPTDRGLVPTRAGRADLPRRLLAETVFKLDYLRQEGLSGWLSPIAHILESLASSGLLTRHRFLPYRTWFQHQLAEYIHAVLTDPCTRRMTCWNTRDLTRIGSDHKLGRRNYLKEINAVLTLEAIDRLLIRGAAHCGEQANEARSSGYRGNGTAESA
jgi:hypothetical protein